MERVLHIQAITKEELKYMLEEVVQNSFNHFKESNKSQNVTVQKASETLNISEQTVRIKIKKGIIPAKKVGRKYLIKRTDLEGILSKVKTLKYRRDG